LQRTEKPALSPLIATVSTAWVMSRAKLSSK
jgi:hypothetical protein